MSLMTGKANVLICY